MWTDAEGGGLQGKGSHNNVPGPKFTTDGNAPRLPSANDHFPNIQSNLVPLFVSVGTFNGLQVQDAHAYWEFNPRTNWVFPAYEIPFTGSVPATFAAVHVGAFDSVAPAPRPAGTPTNPIPLLDNP